MPVVTPVIAHGHGDVSVDHSPDRFTVVSICPIGLNTGCYSTTAVTLG